MKMLDEILKRVKNLTPEQQEKILDILKGWQQGKQREYQRRNITAAVDVAVANRVIQTDVQDISAGGIFINSAGKFEINERVRVVFTVPGHGRPFKLNGKIVRVAQHGMAIEFEGISPYFKTILNDAIWKDRSKG